MSKNNLLNFKVESTFLDVCVTVKDACRAHDIARAEKISLDDLNHLVEIAPGCIGTKFMPELRQKGVDGSLFGADVVAAIVRRWDELHPPRSVP